MGPTYIEQIDAKKTARCGGVLVVTKLFNIAVNYFVAKKSTHCRRVLVVTELVVAEPEWPEWFTAPCWLCAAQTVMGSSPEPPPMLAKHVCRYMD